MHLSINTGGILYIFSESRIKELKQLTYNSSNNEVKIKFEDDSFTFVGSADFVNNIVAILNQPE